MTVRELIKELEALPENYEVCDGDGAGIVAVELGGWPEEEPKVLILAGDD